MFLILGRFMSRFRSPVHGFFKNFHSGKCSWKVPFSVTVFAGYAWTGRQSTKKNLHFQTKTDTCGRGLKLQKCNFYIFRILRNADQQCMGKMTKIPGGKVSKWVLCNLHQVGQKSMNTLFCKERPYLSQWPTTLLITKLKEFNPIILLFRAIATLPAWFPYSSNSCNSVGDAILPFANGLCHPNVLEFPKCTLRTLTEWWYLF